MHVTHYYLLGLFDGPAAAPAPTRSTVYGGGSGGDIDEQIEMGNAAAIQFMIMATLAIEELH